MLLPIWSGWSGQQCSGLRKRMISAIEVLHSRWNMLNQWLRLLYGHRRSTCASVFISVLSGVSQRHFILVYQQTLNTWFPPTMLCLQVVRLTCSRQIRLLGWDSSFVLSPLNLNKIDLGIFHWKIEVLALKRQNQRWCSFGSNYYYHMLALLSIHRSQ